jgi:hypothetical protein
MSNVHEPVEEGGFFRATLADQTSAIDSLERRALTLMQPVAFVLGLAINNAQRVGHEAGPASLFYAGMALLVFGLVMGGVVLWPRRPLRDPIVTPSRPSTPTPTVAAKAIRTEVVHNVGDYEAKTIALRLQLACMITGSATIVAALGLS